MNKSEELAKLLGIKPKAYCAQLQDNEYCSKFQGYMEECKQNCIAIYPDFTEPSNFVKLLHLYKYYLNNSLELNKYSRNYNEHSNINIYINQKIDKAIEIYHWAKEVLDVYNKDFIKQAQQTEWEY